MVNQHLISVLYFPNCLTQLLFLIYQYLIYQLQILYLLNELFQHTLMYQHLLHFLNLLLLNNSINVIQLSLILQKILVLEHIHLFILCLFTNPSIKRTIVAFSFNIQFISFSLYYFFNPKLFLICFSQLFFAIMSTAKYFGLENCGFGHIY